jgi:hypothetical protein
VLIAILRGYFVQSTPPKEFADSENAKQQYDRWEFGVG